MPERFDDLVGRLQEIPKGNRYEVGPAIYARQPIGPDSDTLVLSEEPVDWRSPSNPDFVYVLDIAAAREVLTVWSSWRDGRAPTPADAVNAIMHYASNDSYQPTES